MARRRRHEEHQNHEAWAIPYGDLVTLLLAFFVVMYAISQVNVGKYRVLSNSLVAAFRGGSAEVIAPLPVGEAPVGGRNDPRPTLAPPLPLPLWTVPRRLNPIPPQVHDGPAGGGGAAPALPALGAEPAASDAALHRVADAVETAAADLIASHAIVVRQRDHWVEVELRTDILFPSGAALLAPAAVAVIDRLGDALRGFPNSIRVEGYTDNRPINTPQYPSNWELSAARAATVVQVLARRGVDPARLSVLGLGEYRPVGSNSTLEGRNANRRVLLVIESQSEAGASVAPPAANAAPVAANPAAANPAAANVASPAPPPASAAPPPVASAVLPARAAAPAPASPTPPSAARLDTPPPLPPVAPVNPARSSEPH